MYCSTILSPPWKTIVSCFTRNSAASGCVHPKLKGREFLLVRVAFRQEPRSLDNGVVSSVLKLDSFENLGLVAVHAPVVDLAPVDDDGPLLFLDPEARLGCLNPLVVLGCCSGVL